MSIKTFCATLALLLAACGGGSGDTQPGGAVANPPPATTDIALLFMGNSHTVANNLRDIGGGHGARGQARQDSLFGGGARGCSSKSGCTMHRRLRCCAARLGAT